MQLLRSNARITVRELAAEAGFCNDVAFIRVFKNMRGSRRGSIRTAWTKDSRRDRACA